MTSSLLSSEMGITSFSGYITSHILVGFVGIFRFLLFLFANLFITNTTKLIRSKVVISGLCLAFLKWFKVLNSRPVRVLKKIRNSI